MRKTLNPPTLLLRSAYFIDNLRELTGQGLTRLERRIRENQYEAAGLHAPPIETIRDYFRLRRPVAFESQEKKAKYPPWLLAAEIEVGGSSHAFFHPIFDLLFGQLESSAFWSMHFRIIPAKWIEDAEARGDTDTATEWRQMNEATRKRKHRSRQVHQLDPLSFVHLSMMRLPDAIRDSLFERKGLSSGWTRKYASPEAETLLLESIRTVDSLAALLALVKEAAEIGDMTRFHRAKAALLNHLSVLDELAPCRRIKQQLKAQIHFELDYNILSRRYQGTLYHGFGLPPSWRAHLIPSLIERSSRKIEATGGTSQCAAAIAQESGTSVGDRRVLARS